MTDTERQNRIRDAKRADRRAELPWIIAVILAVVAIKLVGL